MLLSICSEPKILEIMRIVNIIITIIRIVVPLILIFALIFKLIQGMTSGNDDALSKFKKTAPQNIVAAVVIFFVPVLVSLIVKLTFPNNDYSNCLNITTREQINALYQEKVETLINIAEESHNINDYNAAKNYLINIKDSSMRTMYDERLAQLKEVIDEENIIVSTEGKSTGLGREIKLSSKAEQACRYVLNSDTTMIRLYRCDCRYNCMYPAALPGGGKEITMPGQGTGDAPYETNIAKEAINFSRYMKGAFSVEHPGVIKEDGLLESAKAFMVLYKGDFLEDYRFKFNKEGEIQFPIGTCTQCYSDANLIQMYDSGLYRDKIDAVFEEARYFLLVNDDGELTSTEYAGTSDSNNLSPVFLLDKLARNGMSFLDILKSLRTDTTNKQHYYYKQSNVYDCRNLVEDESK